jgi:hypothetical protein
MNADITYLMAMSCALPAAVGIYKYTGIDRKYHPFIYMMVLDAVIETIYYLAYRLQVPGKFTQLAVNIYMLLDFGLFMYFVFINGYLGKKPLQGFLAGAVFVSIFNAVYTGTIFTAFFYLLCYVSAVMLIVSIDILSRQIMATKEKLIDNFWFWVSSFSILYNAFTLLIFGLYFFAMSDSPNGKAIGGIQHFVNMACYVFFALAIYKIPEKKR